MFIYLYAILFFLEYEDIRKTSSCSRTDNRVRSVVLQEKTVNVGKCDGISKILEEFRQWLAKTSTIKPDSRERDVSRLRTIFHDITNGQPLALSTKLCTDVATRSNEKLLEKGLSGSTRRKFCDSIDKFIDYCSYNTSLVRIPAVELQKMKVAHKIAKGKCIFIIAYIKKKKKD